MKRATTRAGRLSRAALRARRERARRLMRADVHGRDLDRAKARTGSDGKTAQYLHTTPQRISDVRKARRHLTPEQAARLAYLIGEPPTIYVLRALADHSRRRQSRNFWLDFSCGIWPGRDLSYNRWAKSKLVKRYPIWGGSQYDR